MGPIRFPSLGLTMNPSKLVFPNSGIHIYWYAVIITFGLVLAVLYAIKRRKTFGLEEDDIYDMLIYAIPSALICARAYYCIFNWGIYADNPISVFYIWEGGIAIYGAVIGAVASVLIYCRITKKPFGPIADVGGLGLLIGQMIGRWGNFINREAYGAETTSFLRMGIIGEDHVMRYYHPTFFYESMWNLIGFVILHFYSKKRKFDGEVFAAYVAWYGLGRAWIEGLRTDSLYLFNTGIRVSQLLAVVSSVAAIAYIIYVRKVRNPQPEDLYVNRRYAEETPEGSEEESSDAQ